MEYFYVYIIKCCDGSYYTGHTDNIEKRIYEHKHKKYDNYTSSRLPIEVVYVQYFASRDAAFVAECRIKGWTRRKKEALILKNWNKLRKYAKKSFEILPLSFDTILLTQNHSG